MAVPPPPGSMQAGGPLGSSAANAFDNGWGNHPTLVMGAQGQAVKDMQWALNQLFGANLPINGVYDENMARTVQDLNRFFSGGANNSNFVDDKFWKGIEGMGGFNGQTASIPQNQQAGGVIQPSYDELIKKATTAVDTNGEYLAGVAGLQSQLDQTLAGYNTQQQYEQSDYERAKLALDRMRGLSQQATDSSLADRGIAIGGIAQDTKQKVNTEYDTQALSNQDAFNRYAADLTNRRNQAQSSFDNSRLNLRQSIIDKLIEQYRNQSLAPVQQM